MKRFAIISLLMFFAADMIRPQTHSWNYILVTKYPHYKEYDSIPSLTSAEQPNRTPLKSITYLDGSARERQTQSSSAFNDSVIISQKYYDTKGRLQAATKPFVYPKSGLLNYINPGDFAASNLDVISGITDHNKPLFKTYGDEFPFERILYLDEPQDRVSQTMPFGDAFHHNNHFAKTTYLTDTLDYSQYVVTEDEDGNQTISETDMSGNTICQTTRLGPSDSLVTSFGYDVQGNLIYTVSPLGNKNRTFESFTNKTELSFGTQVETLTYTKPQYADRVHATITIAIEPAGGGGGQAKLEGHDFFLDTINCNTPISYRYRTFTNGIPDSWKYDSIYDSVIVPLKINQTKIEVQKLSLIEDPPGCFSANFVITMSLYHNALIPSGQNWEAKHVTRYTYNTLSQLTEKISPDEGTTRYVYDNKGQLRFVQDENHRNGFTFRDTTRYWTYYKYDSLGRVLEQGEFNLNSTQASLQTSVTSGILVGPNSYPASDRSITVMNRYDFYGAAGWQIILTGNDTAGSKSKSRVTRTKILDPNSGSWTEKAYTYGLYGRDSLKFVYIPDLQNTKKMAYIYDASGHLLKTSYQPNDASECFFQWYKFDNLGRLDSVWSSRQNSKLTASREAVYDYNDNFGGKIRQMKLGNNIQTVDYAYTIRNWLSSINDVSNMGSDKFAMALGYGSGTSCGIQNGAPESWNSNIRWLMWNASNGNDLDGYAFTYDKANRLSSAVFKEFSGPCTWNATEKYSEKIPLYDANGNIQKLARHANSATGDTLRYTYDTNKPNRLTSNSGLLVTSYTYDGNGNMSGDSIKGVFTYDYRNMPIRITTNDTIIEYAYDVHGQRIKKTIKNAGMALSREIYVLGISNNITAEYRNGTLDHYNVFGNDLIGKLVPAHNTVTIKDVTLGGQYAVQAKDSVIVEAESVMQGEGTLEAGAQLNVTDKRFYYLTDWIGSVRVIVNEQGNLDSWNDFYPNGLTSRNGTSVNGADEQFTGKLYDAETGFSYFGARYHDSRTGNWTSTDPLSEGDPWMSPYNYANRNPVLFVDPNGMLVLDPNGILVGFTDAVRRKRTQIEADIKEFESRGSSFTKEEFETYLKNITDLQDLEQILVELDKMEESEQVFEILLQLNPFKDKGGDTRFNPETNTIRIYVESPYNYGRWAHELKHAYQYLNRELSFDYTGRAGGAIYDLFDEYDAYARYSLFSKETFSMEKLRSIYDIPAGHLGLDTHYDALSTYEERMRASNALGKPRSFNYFIGWDKK